MTRIARTRPGYLAGLALACGAIVFLGWANYRAVERDLTDVALSRRVAVAQLAAVTLSEKFSRLADLSVSLSTRVRFRDLVAAGRWDEAAAILRDVPKDFDFIERLFLTDAAGTLHADIPEAPGVRGRNFASREWYRGVRSQSRPYVSSVYQRAASPQLNVFAVAAPVRDPQGGVSGFLVLQVRVERLIGWLEQLQSEPDVFLYIVDAKGQIAFHSKYPGRREILDHSSAPIMQRMRASPHGVDISFDPVEKVEAVTAYASVPHFGWSVVVQQPARTTAALVARDQQLRLLLTGYWLITLLGAAVAYLVWRAAGERRQAADQQRMKADLERMVAERTTQLEAANKELEAFSYSVSHDLRAPLRAVVGFSKLMVEDHGAQIDEEARRKLEVIRGEAQRMGVLIDDLLAFSRLGRKAMNVMDLDMTQLARSTYDGLDGQHGGPRAELRMGSLPRARGDRALLTQVWANLLSNALKFSSKQQQPLIEVSAVSDENEHIFFVRDNGAGFDPRYQSKLFGVFQRLHNSSEFPGTGVGLALVQRIVTRHGGRVWADSKPGEGATFYFTLPREESHGAV